MALPLWRRREIIEYLAYKRQQEEVTSLEENAFISAACKILKAMNGST